LFPAASPAVSKQHAQYTSIQQRILMTALTPSQYPFEYAKTRSQLSAIPGATRNPLSMIRQIIAAEGIGSIYTGCSTLVIGTMFKASVRFLSFDTIKAQLVDQNGKLSAGRGLLAGLAAGCFESIVAVTPTERLKTAL